MLHSCIAAFGTSAPSFMFLEPLNVVAARLTAHATHILLSSREGSRSFMYQYSADIKCDRYFVLERLGLVIQNIMYMHGSRADSSLIGNKK